MWIRSVKKGFKFHLARNMFFMRKRFSTLFNKKGCFESFLTKAHHITFNVPYFVYNKKKKKKEKFNTRIKEYGKLSLFILTSTLSFSCSTNLLNIYPKPSRKICLSFWRLISQNKFSNNARTRSRVLAALYLILSTSPTIRLTGNEVENEGVVEKPKKRGVR